MSTDHEIPRLALIRKVAATLPSAHEITYHDAPWFNVGRKSFALWSPRDACWILKLPKPLQARLFEERPETFVPMRAGAMVWSYVLVEHLDEAELIELLVAAWRTIALKRVQALYDAASR